MYPNLALVSTSYFFHPPKIPSFFNVQNLVGVKGQQINKLNQRFPFSPDLKRPSSEVCLVCIHGQYNSYSNT